MAWLRSCSIALRLTTRRPTSLHRSVERPVKKDYGAVTVRVAAVEDAPLWASVSARGWAPEHPELQDSLEQFGAVAFAREQTVNFIAELDGEPGAAGTLCLHDRIALFGGASVIPKMRRRGLQSALLEARMSYASDLGYELAMMVTEAGSQSQRNAERKDFRIAYTRTKWRLYRS